MINNFGMNIIYSLYYYVLNMRKIRNNSKYAISIKIDAK